jgi:prepilin-type N-terminal cleavage/methylation domain-containing protein
MNHDKLSFFRVVDQIDTQASSLANHKGFTLIELIVVTTILGILAAMSIPAYNDYINKTKTGKAKSDIRTLCTEINAHIMDNNGAKPADLGVINRLGLKDPWNRPYVYSNSAVLEDTLGFKLNMEFDIYSLGADGQTNVSPVGFPVTLDDIVSYSDGTYVDLRND